MWLTQGIEGGMPRTLRYVLWAIEGSLEFHLAVLWRVRKQSLGPLLNESAEGWGIVQSVLLFDTEMIHSKFWMNAFLDTCKAFIFSLLLCTHHWIGCSTFFPHTWTRPYCLWLFNPEWSTAFQFKHTFEGTERQESGFKGLIMGLAKALEVFRLFPSFSAILLTGYS